MKWTISDARQRFAELIRAAKRRPQPIYNRNQLVAAVVNARQYEAFEAWCRQQSEETIGEAFERLRSIAEQDNYTFKTPERRNRRNAFTEAFE